MAAKLSRTMVELLRAMDRDEAAALADNPSATPYERGYHTGPSTGNTAKALVERGLATRVYRGGRSFMHSYVLTDAGRAELQNLVQP